MTTIQDEPSPVRLALSRYAEVFGELPPLVAWLGTDDQLRELAEKAIDDGKALDEDELIRAQGRQAGSA
jgi:hypothetical protein